MTITIKEARPVRTPKEVTDSSKRRLRRMRVSAAKTGAIVAYEPVSKPVVNDDAPKLTNNAKRMARKRKKYAAQMAELGLTVEDGGASFFKSDKRRKKKKKKSSAVIEGKEDGKPAVVRTTTEGTVTGSQHVRFDAGPEGQPEKTPTKSGKKRKHKKNKKNAVAEDTSLEKTVNDVPTPEKNVEVDDASSLGKKSKHKKIKMDVVSEDTKVEKPIDDKSPIENKINGKDVDDEKVTEEAKPPGKQAAKPKGKKEKKQRFILFIGNLAYDITEDEIKSHFERVGGITSVRISKHTDESMKGLSKGFAHLEVENEEAYLKAMSLHHTFMRKRRINVEYSSGQTSDMRKEQKLRKLEVNDPNSTASLEKLNPCGGKPKARSRFNQTRQPAGSRV